MQLGNLGKGAGYLKAGLLGFAGSGKTYTSALMAIGVRKQLRLTGPIAMCDTEAAAQYVAPLVRRETGLDLMGVQSRALSDAVEFLRECLKVGASIAIIDSVTHLWREVCGSFLKQRNEALTKLGKNPKTRLEFQDWAPIKDKWAVFSDLYLNVPMHVIICGRAGYEYDYEEREDGSGKDLVKTGIRMKTEGEFGFEPSLLIEMERIQRDDLGKLSDVIIHRATVIKDRFGILDGKVCDNPTYDFFRPFVDLLTPGVSVAVDTTRETPMAIDEAGNVEWQRERKERAIYAEEIIGILTAKWPGQSALDKKAKAEALYRTFGTYSWTAVENMSANKLKDGLERITQIIESEPVAEESKPKESPKTKAVTQ